MKKSIGEMGDVLLLPLYETIHLQNEATKTRTEGKEDEGMRRNTERNTKHKYQNSY